MRLLLTFILLITLVISPCALGAENSQVPFALQSQSAVLMEYSTGEIIIDKNAKAPLPPASVTKMMVMLLVMEAVDSGQIKLTDKVIASPEACRMGGSQIWLEPGEEMTVAELMKAVGIVSANDASYALGEYLTGSYEEFIRLMNKRSQELGMNNTKYVNTTGLTPDDGGPGNLTSAYDQAILARELLKHPTVLQWTGTWIDSLRGGESFLRNTNNLVRFYEGCDGLKTGFTDQAGFCLVATAKRNGVRLIAVTMNAPTAKVRSGEISKLFNYGFSQFKAVPILKAGQIVGKTRVFKGEEQEVNLVIPKELTLVLKKEVQDEPEIELTFPPKVRAPLTRGQTVGKALVRIKGEVKLESPIVAGADIKESGLFRFILQITKEFLRSLFN